jgi:hypothetical protein
MMLSTQKQAVALGTVVLLALSLAATAGVASAAETDSLTFEPAFEEEQVLATDNQTLSFTVTNREDEPFDFPIIEIVDSAQIDINETSAVVIDEDGNENNRGTDTLTERESVSGEDVVIIEGEGNEIPPGETVTFEIKVDVLTAGDVEIESLVYPIQNEPADISEVESRDDSVIDTVTTEAFQPGTLNVNVVDESDVGIVVNGNSASTGSYSEEVAAAGVGGESVEYDVGAEIPLADDEVVTLDGVTVPEVTPPRSVEFFAKEEAAQPTIIAQTDSIDIQGLNDPIRQGTAEEPFKKEFNFDLVTDGGQTAIGVDDPSTLDPFNSVDATIDNGEITTDNTPNNATIISVATDDDDVISITYEGFPLGDVTTTGDVTNDDAATIAQSVAAGDEAELNQLYGDVTGDDEINAADAMFIAQYDGGDGPRDEGYNLNGGS